MKKKTSTSYRIFRLQKTSNMSQCQHQLKEQESILPYAFAESLALDNIVDDAYTLYNF
jgi:hypothetical protein